VDETMVQVTEIKKENELKSQEIEGIKVSTDEKTGGLSKQIVDLDAKIKGSNINEEQIIK
jgi:hypothetical protein